MAVIRADAVDIFDVTMRSGGLGAMMTQIGDRLDTSCLTVTARAWVRAWWARRSAMAT
ncbi:hypothetical protein [Oceanicola sp. S124]|uniref:hypothetical protein n=1 Tax=Oceanicola sp. S124 TaxID=1042378 RepID=UPI0002558D95|nr:hypothetical protein [Oceanicola sp. S124]